MNRIYAKDKKPLEMRGFLSLKVLIF